MEELLRMPTVGCRAARTVYHPMGRGCIERHAAPQPALHEMRPSRWIATGAIAPHRRNTVFAFPNNKVLRQNSVDQIGLKSGRDEGITAGFRQ